MNWQNLTERQQIEAEARNGDALVAALKARGLTISGAGWSFSGSREAAAECLRLIGDVGHLSQRTEENADCFAADLRRRFGL